MELKTDQFIIKIKGSVFSCNYMLHNHYFVKDLMSTKLMSQREAWEILSYKNIQIPTNYPEIRKNKSPEVLKKVLKSILYDWLNATNSYYQLKYTILLMIYNHLSKKYAQTGIKTGLTDETILNQANNVLSELNELIEMHEIDPPTTTKYKLPSGLIKLFIESYTI